MSKPNAQTLALIRMAAAALVSHSAGISVHHDGTATVYVNIELFTVLCETTKQTPSTKPVESVKDRMHLFLAADGLTWHSTCWKHDLGRFGVQPPTTTETEEGGPRHG